MEFSELESFVCVWQVWTSPHLMEFWKMFTKRESMTGGEDLCRQLSEMMWQHWNSSKDYGKTARTFVGVGVRIKVKIGQRGIHAMRTSSGYSEMAVLTTLACIATLGVLIRLFGSLGQEEATTSYLWWFYDILASQFYRLWDLGHKNMPIEVVRHIIPRPKSNYCTIGGYLNVDSSLPE